MNPFSALFRSRKFWLAMLDALATTVALIIGTFYPSMVEFTKTLTIIWQPIFIILIGSIAVEDVASIRSSPPDLDYLNALAKTAVYSAEQQGARVDSKKDYALAIVEDGLKAKHIYMSDDMVDAAIEAAVKQADFPPALEGTVRRPAKKEAHNA